MARRWALLFGTTGYMLSIWYYSAAFAPLTSDFGKDLLHYMCLSCMSITGFRSGRLTLAFLALAPINALIYAIVGFLAGKLVHALKKG